MTQISDFITHFSSQKCLIMLFKVKKKPLVEQPSPSTIYTRHIFLNIIQQDGRFVRMA